MKRNITPKMQRDLNFQELLWFWKSCKLDRFKKLLWAQTLFFCRWNAYLFTYRLRLESILESSNKYFSKTIFGHTPPKGLFQNFKNDIFSFNGFSSYPQNEFMCYEFSSDYKLMKNSNWFFPLDLFQLKNCYIIYFNRKYYVKNVDDWLIK